MLLTTLGLVACVEPFEYGRHDLVDLRIVGMGFEFGTARAFVWEGAQAFSKVAPAQVWSGDFESGDCPADSDCGAKAGPRETSVVVDSGEQTESGTLIVESEAAEPVLGLASIEWDADVATITLEAPDTHVTRWMTPAGELVEVGAHTVEFTPVGEGLFPLVALTTDGLGGNGWTVVDVPFGSVGATLGVGNRRLPLVNAPDDASSGQAEWLGTVVAADNVYGFALDQLRPDDGSADVEGCGVESGVWNPDRIVERACGLNTALGVTVRLTGTVVP